ncbi:Endonuclease 4 [Ancistrocladus abbreviatus]
MGSSKLFWVGRAVVFLQMIPAILSWGQHGHYATCKIAEGYLTEDARAAVNELLPESAEGELAAVCSWADDVRFHYHWSSALHYVDTPDFRCQYDYSRDCHDSAGNKNRCVVGAIYNYTQQLISASEVKYNLTEALMFLSHFVGDVHQPLHVGFTGDEGGNTIEVRWYRRKTNLHHVWDVMIIDSALTAFYGSDLTNMIEAIQENITNNWSGDMVSWEACASNQTACPDPYASESVELACKYAYRNATAGSTLEDDYFLSRLPIVEKRLAQGGIRLAGTLNRIFASKPPRSMKNMKMKGAWSSKFHLSI